MVYAYTLEDIANSDYVWVITIFGVLLPISGFGFLIQYSGTRSYMKYNGTPLGKTWTFTILKMVLILPIPLAIFQILGIMAWNIEDGNSAFYEFRPSILHLIMGIGTLCVIILGSACAIGIVCGIPYVIFGCMFGSVKTTTKITSLKKPDPGQEKGGNSWAVPDDTKWTESEHVSYGCCVPIIGQFMSKGQQKSYNGNSYNESSGEDYSYATDAETDYVKSDIDTSYVSSRYE